MQRVLFAVAAFVLTGAAVATAEDPKPAQPAQPKVVQPKVVQPKILPVQPRPIAVTAARMSQLEEDFETLEAHREVKKAHVVAAEVAVRASEATFERVSKTAMGGTISKEELNQAKFGLEMAKAQLHIRVAELKEVEVKVKFAKKRLDDAKAAGVRPLPGIRPLPVDPKATDPLPNVRFAADEKEIAELKTKIAKLTAEAAKVAAETAKADAELKVAEAELKRIVEIAKLGRVKAGTIEAAEAKAAKAMEVSAKLAKQRNALEATLANLRAKLKELQK